MLYISYSGTIVVYDHRDDGELGIVLKTVFKSNQINFRCSKKPFIQVPFSLVLFKQSRGFGVFKKG